MTDLSKFNSKKEKKTIDDLITRDSIEERQAEKWLDTFLKHPVSPDWESVPSTKQKSKEKNE